LAVRRLQAAEADTTFKWNILDAKTAIKSRWSRANESTIRNYCRTCGFMQAKQDELKEEYDRHSFTANI